MDEVVSERIVVEIEPKLKHKLQVKCAKDKVTIKDAITDLVKSFVKGGSK